MNVLTSVPEIAAWTLRYNRRSLKPADRVALGAACPNLQRRKLPRERLGQTLVRLGMLNAAGPQDLIVYVLTQRGRVETTNYRTVKLPSDVELPIHVRSDFGTVYRALFDEQARRVMHRTQIKGSAAPV